MSLKANLTQAKTNKKDEFYTQLKDIENELRHYKEHFKDKTKFFVIPFVLFSFQKLFQER